MRERSVPRKRAINTMIPGRFTGYRLSRKSRPYPGNAGLGALSEPGGRYQSRVIWLVPLLAGCFVLKLVRGDVSRLSSGADA